MRRGFLKLFCAAALAVPSAAIAQTKSGGATLRTAFTAEEGFGDVAVYISDAFRRSAPLAPGPLSVITMKHGSPGDALNNPAESMNALHGYLKTNGGFAAKDVAAVAVSRDIIRVYFSGEHRVFADKFSYAGASLRAATAAEWARLRAIGIPDFSRYLAKSATRQAAGMRWVFGDRIPPVDGRTVELNLGIEPASAGKGKALASALKRRRYEQAFLKVDQPSAGTSIAVQAKFPFSEVALQRVMNAICADAAKSGGACVSWGARFEPIKLDL